MKQEFKRTGVYRTGKMYDLNPIVLYNFQRTRNATHPEEFLKGYEGTLVTDGYSAYHAMEKKVPVRYQGVSPTLAGHLPQLLRH
ncbi:MAG: hypothetical protein K0S71_1866 [Clostridia bacterium]|jgi:hypothetical protein|nr:hypothetical protein [Clostridia bacterium]